MISIDARHTSPAKRPNSATLVKSDKLKATGKQTPARPAANKVEPRDARHLDRVTKRDRILTLLGRRDGATFPEIIEVCDWQQHRVRGLQSRPRRSAYQFA